MNSKDLKGLFEAYSGVYSPQELTEDQIWEEVENWVNSLLEEGYDLSEYSWEEMYEDYISEAPNWAARQELARLGSGLGKLKTLGTSLVKQAAAPVLGAYTVLNTKAQQAGAKDFERRSGGVRPGELYRASDVGPDGKPKAGATTQTRNIETAVRGGTAPPRLPQQPQQPLVDKSGRNVFDGTSARPPAPPKPEVPRKSSESSPARASSIARGSGPTASSPRPAATPAAQPKPAAPTGPAIGKLGSTSFERRTPTSAELKAAQKARAGGASPEEALKAAQKTNLPTTGPTPAVPNSGDVNKSIQNFKPRDMNKNPLKPATQTNSFEWGSTSKLVDDIANLYQSVYEAKKVDQDEDGDNDFADVRIARLIASGMSKEEAIAKVKNKPYNEEVEIDEATRMRKELGKEGEIATRKELSRRSNAYKRSDTVDKTIAAAEREADRTTVRNRDESEGNYKTRMQKRSQTLRGLAANRRKSVRSGEGLRGYAAKVTGGDRDLQSARGSARSAGTLTNKERKQFGEEFDLWVNALIYEGYDLSDYTWDEMIEIYDDLYEQTALEQKKAKEEALAARRARIKELTSQGRVMTSSRRTSEKAKQSKERQRLERLERLGDDVLRQVTGGSGRVSDKPMGSGNPTEKEDAPEATRRLRTGLRRDDLGTAADDILKKIRKEK